MKRLFLISICILLAGCCTRQVCMTKTPNSRPFSHDQMIAGMNAFSADLYTQLEAGNKDNIFYSPFSISAAMSLLYTGARGETADNLQKVLHFGPQHETFSSTMGEIVTTHSA